MTTPKPLRWKRSHEGEGVYAWWAKRGPLSFSLYYQPPTGSKRKATIELASWASDCEEPTVRRDHAFLGDLAAFERELSAYQRALIHDTAEAVEDKAASIRALLS